MARRAGVSTEEYRDLRRGHDDLHTPAEPRRLHRGHHPRASELPGRTDRRLPGERPTDATAPVAERLVRYSIRRGGAAVSSRTVVNGIDQSAAAPVAAAVQDGPAVRPRHARAGSPTIDARRRARRPWPEVPRAVRNPRQAQHPPPARAGRGPPGVDAVHRRTGRQRALGGRHRELGARRKGTRRADLGAATGAPRHHGLPGRAERRQHRPRRAAAQGRQHRRPGADGTRSRRLGRAGGVPGSARVAEGTASECVAARHLTGPRGPDLPRGHRRLDRRPPARSAGHRRRLGHQAARRTRCLAARQRVQRRA